MGHKLEQSTDDSSCDVLGIKSGGKEMPWVYGNDAYVAGEVISELSRARTVHPTDYHSAHEGYAVILEELDRLWEIVKINPDKYYASKENWKADMKREAIHVAAMAIRFITDVCK